MKTKKLTLLLTAAMFLMGAGSITNGLPTDAPEDGGDNTNSTIEVDAKKNPSSSTWDGWTEYTSWDD